MTEDVKNLWTGFVGSLMLDVEDALQRQESQDSPTTRRGLIRTLIAAVEGLVWIYREHVLDIAKEMDELSDKERAALADTATMVDDRGRISEQKRYLSTIATIRLMTRIAQKFAPDCEPDFGDAGWSDLKDTFALRNRITHPKREVDLEISEQNVARAVSAFHWFNCVVIAVMTQSNNAFRRDVEALSEVADLLMAGDEKMLELYRKVSGGPAPGDLHNP